MKKLFSFLFIIITFFNVINAQDDSKKLQINGDFTTDQRLSLKNDNDWIWNENRLSLEFNKKIFGKASFYSEVWLRNFGLPQFNNTSSLYNKGIIDPYDLEFREAYVQVHGFLSDKIDLTVGRQKIKWGKADQINPTDYLNPYDFEDLLDFGRTRSSDAIKFDYYINNDFSLTGVFVPFYKPANLPVGVFADVFSQNIEVPQGMNIMYSYDSLALPKQNLEENMSAGFRFKGFIAGIDFSLIYIYGRDFLPQPYEMSFLPVDQLGNLQLNSKYYFNRQHIAGLNIAGNIAGVGYWAEAAMYAPTDDVVLSTDLSALYPTSPQPVIIDSTIIAKDEPYFKYVVGFDYNFSNDFYFNMQYVHGFLHERGREQLNDYYFLRFEKSFFYDKLKIVPISGAFSVTDYSDIQDNYALAYIPELIYNPTDNFEITLSAAFFEGEGENMFSQLKDYNMLILKMKYSF